MTSSLAIRKRELAVESQGHWVDLVKKGMDSTVTLLQNPAFTMIASMAIIELLGNTVTYGTGKYEEVSQPGTNAKILQEVRVPLLTQTQQTTLETVIVSTEGLKSIVSGIDLSGILKLVGR